MAISTLQREAFIKNDSFNQQVNGIVQTEAIQKADADPTAGGSMLAGVIRNPTTYGFVPTIVAQSVWSIGFDTWAADPNHADVSYAITAGVQKYFNLLTGYQPPAAARTAGVSYALYQ